MNTITPPLSRRILPAISLYFYGLLAYIVAMIFMVVFQNQGYALIALLPLFIGAILLIISSVFYFINTYRVWREINSLKPWLSPEDAKKVPSPGTAIAFLFIPFFNIYWIFICIGKIPYYFNKAYQGEQEINAFPFKQFCNSTAAYYILYILYILHILYNITPLPLELIFISIYIVLSIAIFIFWVQSQLLYKRIMAIREQGDPSRDLTS